MEFLTIFTLFLIAGGVICEPLSKDPDYYWRYYFGRMPEDALLGGYDQAGKPKYVGQLYHNFKMIPSYAGGKSLQEQLHGKVEILCTRNPCRYKWIPTNSTHIRSLESQYTLISGGYDHERSVYFGRVNFDMELRIGPVYLDGQNFNFEIPHLDGQRIFKSYQVLVYDYKNQECVRS
ncbi:hypothetical protein PPYR_13984 [Photinus pyralis]|uniref:Uncharacterized protein n=1 Tax=Photinus pyralis TaxID=7054 RepID=A0A5N4A3X4_PHOPY|nr:uncharacterized protein LOC116180581 [Photinus pyralis]KAB0792023.1 hypothetical protein PPYR_13984 [Photinus pyralis]